jgi:hypothetical protein
MMLPESGFWYRRATKHELIINLTTAPACSTPTIHRYCLASALPRAAQTELPSEGEHHVW